MNKKHLQAPHRDSARSNMPRTNTKNLTSVLQIGFGPPEQMTEPNSTNPEQEHSDFNCSTKTEVR